MRTHTLDRVDGPSVLDLKGWPRARRAPEIPAAARALAVHWATIQSGLVITSEVRVPGCIHIHLSSARHCEPRGGEADVRAADRGLVVRVLDGVDVDVAGEPVGWSC